MKTFPGAQLSGRKKLSAPRGPPQHYSIASSPACKGILHSLLLLLSLCFPRAWGHEKMAPDQALVCD